MGAIGQKRWVIESITGQMVPRKSLIVNEISSQVHSTTLPPFRMNMRDLQRRTVTRVRLCIPVLYPSRVKP